MMSTIRLFKQDVLISEDTSFCYISGNDRPVKPEEIGSIQ